MSIPALPAVIHRALRAGTVIPAHPLALTAARKLDERRQRALTRYYLAAGAGGLAPEAFLDVARAGLGPQLGGSFDPRAFRRTWDP